MKFDYYYQNQVEQFQFIMIPRVMYASKEFEGLSYAAKLLYGLLRDKCSLSAKNNWVDENGRVYIIYTISDIMRDMCMSEKMAVQYLKELETFGLVEKKRRGLGMPNLLFVKSFVADDESKCGNDDSEGSSRTIEKASCGTTQKGSLRLSDMVVQDLPDATNNNTNIIHTELNHTESNHTNPNALGMVEQVNGMREIISNHICYEELLDNHPSDLGLIDGIRELITDVLMLKTETVVIAKQELPVRLVQQKFIRLQYAHVEYVIDWLKEHPVKIANPRKYLLALLYNASESMDAYYTAEVARMFAS